MFINWTNKGYWAFVAPLVITIALTICGYIFLSYFKMLFLYKFSLIYFLSAYIIFQITQKRKLLTNSNSQTISANKTENKHNAFTSSTPVMQNGFINVKDKPIITADFGKTLKTDVNKLDTCIFIPLSWWVWIYIVMGISQLPINFNNILEKFDIFI